ncbi:hypothetical protein MNB_SV-6-510 [hydrothermal vent metagenome]|uniref:OmpA-like domain-containing protein n=1 Tax=hydrothermal vent metagenome TaxID=652676 RepID=A0A1W1CAQ1_9ZZZZ
MNDLEKLKTLLLKEEIDKIDEITSSISSLQNQQKRDVLVDRLSAIITDILSKSLDENKTKLYSTLKPIISKGVLDELNDSNNNLKEMLFPIISSSIQEQVRNQKDSIVDALYPIMGNMISKYVSTAFKDMMYEVNDKIQNSLSFSTIQRKIKSKLYGISEAELLLRETDFVDIKTVFLIHKESGLLITNLHKEDKDKIEDSEMVASMLSAIRSFVNDWISSHNTMSEISEIEYGNSSIHIESAGSCYLAAVSNGNTDMKDRLSKVLSQIVDRHSIEISQFDGDSSSIDIADINSSLSTLFEEQDSKKERSTPIMSILFFLVLLLIPVAYYINESYDSYLKIKTERNIETILQEYHIHVYDLQIQVDKNHTATIDGLILDDSDMNKTDFIFRGIKHINNLKSIDQNFDKNYKIRERMRLKKDLKYIVDNINRKYGSNIKYDLIGNTVVFKGAIIDEDTKDSIIAKLSDHFGYKDREYNFTLLENIDGRVYFDVGSDLISEEYNSVLDRVVALHRKNSNYLIKISAYTDSKGSYEVNKKISYRRANRVKVALIKKGMDSDKIVVEYRPTPPDDLLSANDEKMRSLSRCVIFNWERDIDD